MIKSQRRLFLLILGSILLILLILILSACQTQAESVTSVLDYKGSYVGDNTAISAISRTVSSTDTIDHFKLQTKEEPYGVHIYYLTEDRSYTMTTINQESHRQSLYLYYLIDNVDYLVLHFNDHIIRTERTMYANDLKIFAKEAHLSEKFINNYIVTTYLND